jgi:hypothetical protein
LHRCRRRAGHHAQLRCPRDLVFKAFSESERLAQWWGPKGLEIDVVKVEFRPGGVFHYCMRAESRASTARAWPWSASSATAAAGSIASSAVRAAHLAAPRREIALVEIIPRALTYAPTGDGEGKRFELHALAGARDVAPLTARGTSTPGVVIPEQSRSLVLSGELVRKSRSGRRPADVVKHHESLTARSMQPRVNWR